MKSKILRTFLITMLLVSSAALGAIQSLGSRAYLHFEATASGSTDYDEKGDSVWYFEYTDVGAYCGWTYSLSAEAEARVTLMLDEYASATAVADAEVYGVDSNDVFQSASVSGTGEYNGQFLEDDPEEPDSTSGGGDGWVPAFNGIVGDVDAFAEARIDEGSDCLAYAEATADADVDLQD